MAVTEATDSAEVSARRNPAPIIVLVVVVLLACYYVVLWATGALSTSTAVPLEGAEQEAGTTDYVTLNMRVHDVDLINRVVKADVLPVPHGALVGERSAEVARSVRVEVGNGAGAASVVTFPDRSVIDPAAVSLTLERGDSAYPLDRPFANFTVSVQDDETGESIPFVLDLTNSARPWVMSGTLDEPLVRQAVTHVPVTLQGHRDVLNITVVAFYVLAILFTTLIAVITIGGAILRSDLQFSNIIWLSATMLAFPALRSAMPGAPPIGTTLDFVVFFPSMCLIAAMLLWTGVYLIGQEHVVLRRLRLHHEQDGGD
jgi:hypothetical protein